MRTASILLATVLFGALAGCSNADRIAFATPMPEARITSATALVGDHGVAGIEGVEFTSPVADRGWGLVTSLRVPGAGEIGLYEPRHPTAL